MYIHQTKRFNMRHLIILLFVLCTTLTYAQYVDVNAVEIPIGYYVSKGDKKTVYAFTSPDTAEVKAIAIIPEVCPNIKMDLHYKRLVIPYSNDNLNRLKEIGIKYTEWSQIAIREKVPMMTKTIDIEIPDIYILTYQQSIDKPRHDDYHISLQNKKFIFTVPSETGLKPKLQFMIRGKDPSRESSDVIGTHSFYDVIEIDELLELIEPVKLNETIKYKTIDKLFK